MEKAKLAYSVAEVAEQLGIGRAAAYDLVQSAEFPKIVVGRRIIIPAAPLALWLERQSQSGGGAGM